jgi:hypothetical protein
MMGGHAWLSKLGRLHVGEAATLDKDLLASYAARRVVAAR